MIMIWRDTKACAIFVWVTHPLSMGNKGGANPPASFLAEFAKARGDDRALLFSE